MLQVSVKGQHHDGHPRANPPPYQPDEIIQSLLEAQLEKPLSIGDFEGREQETFAIVDGDHRLDLELIEVTRLDAQAGSPRQEPGSLLFRMAKDWSVEPRMYRLVSEGHQDIVLYLNTVVGDGTDTEYRFLESVLN
jgi:hypothetical protein